MGIGSNKTLNAKSGEDSVTDKMRRMETIIGTVAFCEEMIR
jgi:hypothetical protein